MAYSKEQNKFTEIIHEEVTVSVLLDKDSKSKNKTWAEIKEIRKMICVQNENINKKIDVK